MMNYNQWNITQNNLFHELNELTPNSIINMLGVEELNLFYMMKHGNKEMLPSLERVNTKEVAKVINSMFMNKWNALSELYLNTLDVGFDSSVTSTSNNVNASNKHLSTNSTSKVSAYNDDELTDVSGEIDNVTETLENSSDNSSTTTTRNIKSIDIQRLLLENSNITMTICNDISSVLCLSIY